MRREELKTCKFIFPNGDWRCWICEKEKRNLELFAETEKEVCLVCAVCFERNVRDVLYGLDDF